MLACRVFTTRLSTDRAVGPRCLMITTNDIITNSLYYYYYYLLLSTSLGKVLLLSATIS